MLVGFRPPESNYVKLSYSIYLYALKAVNVVNTLFPINKDNMSYDIVLCYHDVCDDPWEFSVTPFLFKEQISALFDKYKIVSLQEIVETPNTSENIRIAISFDDGYKGVYSKAFPILSSFNATAAVFILGDASINPKEPYESKLLRNAEIKKLHAAGWIIGWHTNTHQNVTKLDVDILSKELVIAKKETEKSLGFMMYYFAYPYGVHSSALKDTLEFSEIKAAFTVDGNYASIENPFEISRITITQHITPQLLLALISPLGIKINKTFTAIWRFIDKFKQHQ